MDGKYKLEELGVHFHQKNESMEAVRGQRDKMTWVIKVTDFKFEVTLDL